MKTFEEIESLWKTYCQESSVEIGDNILLGYNPSEDIYKISIQDRGNTIDMSLGDFRKLISIGIKMMDE